MKLMIASDIHGSLYYCRKMVECYERERAGKLVLLGDLLYHGPRNDLPKGYAPKGVITLLNGMKNELLCVRGNCDAEVDQMVLEFPILAESMILYLWDRMIFVTHGHRVSAGNMPPLKKGDILLRGHTHVPGAEMLGGYACLNPGSVSIPKEGSPPSYMVIEDGVFYFRGMDGAPIRDPFRLDIS